MKLTTTVVVLFATVVTAVEEQPQPCVEKWSDGGKLLHRVDILNNSDSRLDLRISPVDAKVPATSLFVVVDAIGNYSGKIETIGIWIASASPVYALISPLLFDLLTLGALDVSQRYDRVLHIDLATPLCEGRTADVMRGVVQSVSLLVEAFMVRYTYLTDLWCICLKYNPVTVHEEL